MIADIVSPKKTVMKSSFGIYHHSSFSKCKNIPPSYENSPFNLCFQKPHHLKSNPMSHVSLTPSSITSLTTTFPRESQNQNRNQQCHLPRYHLTNEDNITHPILNFPNRKIPPRKESERKKFTCSNRHISNSRATVQNFSTIERSAVEDRILVGSCLRG